MKSDLPVITKAAMLAYESPCWSGRAAIGEYFGEYTQLTLVDVAKLMIMGTSPGNYGTCMGDAIHAYDCVDRKQKRLAGVFKLAGIKYRREDGFIDEADLMKLSRWIVKNYRNVNV